MKWWMIGLLSCVAMFAGCGPGHGSHVLPDGTVDVSTKAGRATAIGEIYDLIRSYYTETGQYPKDYSEIKDEAVRGVLTGIRIPPDLNFTWQFKPDPDPEWTKEGYMRIRIELTGPDMEPFVEEPRIEIPAKDSGDQKGK